MKASSTQGGHPDRRSPWIRLAIPGTCGELVQGTLDGADCLVSCPIAWYSTASGCLNTDSEWRVEPERPKSRAALHEGLHFLRHPEPGGRITLASELPRGRGYGSSTADIGATLSVLGHLCGEPLTPHDMSRLALRVEPTDSSLFPGLALWDHRSGQRSEAWGPPPPMTVAVLDPGGRVDTLAYNRGDHRTALRRLASCHREAFTLLREGLQQREPRAIGAAATMSATVHQAILPNPLLDPALQLAGEVEAFGVCRAHSGTILGLLLDRDPASIDQVQRRVAQRFAGQVHTRFFDLVGGGVSVVDDEVTCIWTS